VLNKGCDATIRVIASLIISKAYANRRVVLRSRPKPADCPIAINSAIKCFWRRRPVCTHLEPHGKSLGAPAAAGSVVRSSDKHRSLYVRLLEGAQHTARSHGTERASRVQPWEERPEGQMGLCSNSQSLVVSQQLRVCDARNDAGSAVQIHLGKTSLPVLRRVGGVLPKNQPHRRPSRGPSLGRTRRWSIVATTG